MIDKVLQTLGSRPVQLNAKDEWLFVTVNTMKSIIDNSKKEDVGEVLKAADCSSVAELQRMYDMIQGRYGREGFSYRNNPSYHYLSSLVAGYPDAQLDEADKEKIKDYYGEAGYLLYRI